MHYRLIAGLGNPSKDYENTYHNVGLLALNALEKKIEAMESISDARRHKDLFEYKKAGPIVLVRPLVFMNESGRAIKEAMRVFKVPAEEILIMHDDSDLLIGEFKISHGQNAAGHHGVESTIAAIHSKEFGRARIGIREKILGQRKKASEFVLSPISAKNKKILAGVFETIAEKVLEEEQNSTAAPSAKAGRSLKKNTYRP